MSFLSTRGARFGIFCITPAFLVFLAVWINLLEQATDDIMAAPPLLDVLIIGGGPAGLAVATGLARQLYSAVVFDSGVYRNALTKHMHNVPTWDHRDPAEFRAKAVADLKARYSTVWFESAKIESVRQTPKGHFQATDSQSRVWTGRKLVLATGARDVAPDIAGYEDCWARGVYHCLFCHGYEDRGVESAGVLAIGEVGNGE
ncbi:hypothetical protein F5B21DRAFT_169597 [Xylaria acuta]|nr:hypothetical protein F5B21DRAFT_169597 [Xylaria acuta]